MKLRSTLLAAALLLMGIGTYGQTCAMCYSSAAAASQESQRALRRGIVVLIVPPMGFVTLGLALALRYGRKRDLEQS